MCIRDSGFTFQPSELVKIALIIMLAWYCDQSQRKMDTFKRGIIFPGVIIALALGLIFVEPDRGKMCIRDRSQATPPETGD